MGKIEFLITAEVLNSVIYKVTAETDIKEEEFNKLSKEEQDKLLQEFEDSGESEIVETTTLDYTHQEYSNITFLD